MFLNCKNAGFKKGRIVAPSFAFLLASLVCFIVLTGCESEPKVDPKFVDAFIDLRVAEITFGADSPTARLARQNALKNSGYTREQFLAETDKLLSSEKLWVPFQVAVVARIDSIMAAPKSTPAEPAATPAKAVNAPQMPARKGGVK